MSGQTCTRPKDSKPANASGMCNTALTQQEYTHGDDICVCSVNPCEKTSMLKYS
uniref:Uncharacterized protein n=1 Tax=Anguilla anguilla TaxID=7936 RepID=A0A0E9PAE9_ANGAN